VAKAIQRTQRPDPKGNRKHPRGLHAKNIRMGTKHPLPKNTHPRRNQSKTNQQIRRINFTPSRIRYDTNMRYLILLPLLCTNLSARGIRITYQPEIKRYPIRTRIQPSTASRPLWPSPKTPNIKPLPRLKQQKPKFDEYKFYKLKQKMGYKEYDDQYNRWKQSTQYLTYLDKKNKPKPTRKEDIREEDIDKKNQALMHAITTTPKTRKDELDDIGDE